MAAAPAAVPRRAHAGKAVGLAHTMLCRPLRRIDEYVRAIRAAFPFLRAAPPGAPRNVLSFLVTFFFARAKKEVTRSSAGGVEALDYLDCAPRNKLSANPPINAAAPASTAHNNHVFQSR